MEQLIQKYIKYFYATLIIVIFIQLIDTVITTVMGNNHCDTLVLMFLSAINLVLLSGSLIYNIKQTFTESKTNAKILRFTMALLIITQATLCYKLNPNIISLGNHLMTLAIIEIIFNYRIKTIEHLENLASKFVDESKEK